MIPVSEPLLVGNERKYLLECIDSGWLGCNGPFVSRFEEECKRYFRRKHALAVSSGTAALHTALAALGVGPGDEVIVPVFTYVACAFAVSYLGARPVFVDCDPRTYNIDPALIEASITPRTKAIMVAHIYGLPCDMGPITALARKYNLPVLEDAAEVHGQCYHGEMCGGMGDISILSFYGNKNVACGEGGMVLTDNAELAEKCRYFSGMCQDPYRRYKHDAIGHNYRMSNMQAAVGLAQLEQIHRTIELKRSNGFWYNQLLAPYADVLQLPITRSFGSENIYWVYPLVHREQHNSFMVRSFRERGIETRPFFYPMHMQQPYRLANLGLRFPVAEHISQYGFYLPSGAILTQGEIERVVDVLKRFL